ncbi:MAG: thiol-disulfide isomerase [Vicinamibacterales bacterium]
MRSCRWLAAGTVGTVLLLGAATSAQAPAPPTFSKDVAPILYKHCVSCHQPGNIAPMSLLTFNGARPFARSIKAKVVSGTMPPWHADAPVGTFSNDRRLTDAEKDIISRWVDGGALQGDAKDMPPAPKVVDGWEIGTPDVVFTMAKPFDVPASGAVDYQYVEIPTNFTEDKWVSAIELKPGALSVVHHILAYARDPNATAPPSQAFKPVGPSLPPRPAQTDAQGAGRPRPPRGTPPRNVGVLIATTAPGTNAMTWEPGQAMLLKAGTILTFQLHYTANGKATTDQSSIGLIFAKEPPRQEVHSSAFVNATFAIPPGATDYQIDSAIEFNENARILALFPHTHLRGRSWEYRLVYPDGRSEVVLSVPHYDFNWQTYYQFAKPLRVPKGARLEASARYDNSAANRSNPDPKIEVRWGEQTWEEMQYSGITFVVDEPGGSAN